MEKNKCGNRYSPEVRERAVGMVFEHQGEFDSQSAAIKSIAPKIPYISTQCRFSFMGGFGQNRLSRRGNVYSTGRTGLLLNLWTRSTRDNLFNRNIISNVLWRLWVRKRIETRSHHRR
ncbi:hypothetical protein LCGC14_0325220 [marine sediment metagenome]|jgi:hypothetical protein|uniref:Uncharacterized protein n=1 Tax=marine sediment metagenome TaxID=412755 RepID=A0A0F9WQ56_9ZZZZ